MDVDDDDGAHCLTGFSSVASAASVIATEESRNVSQLLMEFLSSDEEEEVVWGGSKPGKSANLEREFDEA